MKKIMYGMTALSAAVFIFLSFFTYIVEIDNIATTKVAFHIMTDTDKEYTVDELIRNLNEACQSSNTDVLVRKYQHDNNGGSASPSTNIIYKTNNNTDFLKWNTETGNCIIPSGSVLTNKEDLSLQNYSLIELYMPHIMGDYIILSLEDMTSKDWSAVTCYTNAGYLNKLSAECRKYGITVEKQGGIILKSNYFVILLAVSLVMLGLSFLSMLFWQLSESKKIAIKRLEGFSFLQIVENSIVVFFTGFLPICIITFFLGCIVCSVWESFSLFIYFLIDYKFVILGYLVAWIFAFVVSCTYIIIVHPLYAIKGRKKQKGLYRLTFFVKMCLIAVIGLVSFYSFVGYRTMKTTIAIQNNMSETFSDYYHFLSNSNVNLTSNDELEDLYHGFYIAMSEFYDPVLMDASSASSMSQLPKEKLNEFNEHISNYNIINNRITVNKYYLEMNPVYTMDDKQITCDYFPDNQLILLLPYDLDENLVKECYKNTAEFEGYESDSIFTIKYAPDQKFYYFSTDIKSEKPGFIENPVVVVEQNFLHPLGWFSQGNIIFKAKSDDFYNEVLPIMNECNISKYIAGTVSVSGEIQTALNWDMNMMFLYVTILVCSIVLFCCVLLYECIVYYKNNQKRITIKKMNGFSFFQIHCVHLLVRMLFYIIVAAYFLIVGCPLWFGLAVILLDFICFYLVLESKSAKYAATVLKGDIS